MSNNEKSAVIKLPIGIKKTNSLIVITAIFAVLVVVCVVCMVMPNKSYSYDIEGVLSSEEEGIATIICDNIELPVGIYYLELQYVPQENDISAYMYVQDGTVFDGGLLCDGDVLWAGRDSTKCELRLYEATENLQVCMQLTKNTSEFQYGRLTISETDYLWSMLLVNLLFLWAIVVAIILFVDNVKAGKIDRVRIIEIVALGLIAIVGSKYFTIGTIPSGPDTGYHLERIESVAYSIRDGIFPIRLEAFYPFGYGYANGIFYCDLSFYIPGLLRVAGFSVQSAFNMFGIVCVVAGIITSFYCFKKIFENSYIAILGVILNSLAIYHNFDAVLRGGTGFLVASIFFPVLLYGYYRLFSENTEDRKYSTVWIPISVGYTGILCSHVLSLEISAIWTVVVLLTMLPRIFRRKTLLELLKALGAVTILNLWFLVPFADYYINVDVRIKNVSARTIQSMGMPYDTFLVLPLSTNDMSLQLFSTAALLLVIAFIGCWIVGVWKPYKSTGFMTLAKICAIYSLISIVLSTKYFPWDNLHSLNPLFEKVISAIQFPYRFLGYADLFAAITICAFIWCVWQYKYVWLKYALTTVTVLGILAYSVYYIEYTALQYNSMHLYDITMQSGYLSGGEYTVFGTDYENIRPWLSAKTSDNVVVEDYIKKDLAADVVVANISESEGYVDVPLLYYRDYKAYASDGTQMECVSSEEYYVRTIIPAGYSGEISVKFISPWYWRVAEVIGYISWILLIVYVVRRRKEAKN